MEDYSGWKPAKEKVVNLQLDPLNPRIPDPQPTRSQAELIAYLVENDNVYELANYRSGKRDHGARGTSGRPGER